MQNDVKKKIRKLLALARKAGTEAEAANAMEKVHKFLLKHNLSLSEVDVREYDMLVEDITPDQEWQTPLWTGVASLYLGKYFINNNPPKHIIIGQPDNIQVIRDTIRQLVMICDSLTIKFANNAQYKRMPVLNGFGHISHIVVPNLDMPGTINSYKRGFAMRVHNRCMQEIDKAKQYGVGAVPDAKEAQREVIGTALVIATLYEQEAERVASFLSDAGVNVEQKSMNVSVSDQQAFMTGFNAGGDVTLSHKAELR